MTTHIVCPSGLAGEIRGLKGKEGALLSDQKAARNGALFDKLLSNCWLSTTDAGIYELPESGAPDWSKVLVADRFYALLQIRARTFGDEYAFSVQCASPACRERFEWTLNLQELPIVPLSDASKAAFKAGNRFATTLSGDGRRVWFRLMTGADEARAAQMFKTDRDGALLTALALRIVEIEGVPAQDKRRFLDELELGDAASLLEQFDAADGGVETDIQIECPACAGVQDVQLPLERGFFLPTSRGKTAPAARQAEL